MKKIEILAPAGSYESLVAAVNANADAVYIGGSKFGARAFANNLEEDSLLQAIDYVHLHGKQIYLTINTLLKNKEIKNELYEYVERYYRHGVDAVIVQDVGVMEFIHLHFPDLPIHISTQMTLTMAAGLELFKEKGVTRLVTSRELSLGEIADIRRHTDLEIESFVHGALCYCYSGQCFMSSMIGGRSGNRGRCAQPCRMPYTLWDNQKKMSTGENQYLLSPKDICTLHIIPELIEAGIDSFKIEGRMKRPEYTAIVVSKYRKYVDLYTSLGKEGYSSYLDKHKKEFDQDIEELMDIYNRGNFTEGYYKQQNGKNMISLDRPNHNGILIGEVTQVKGNQAQIRLIEDINAQDLLEIREKNEGIYEFTVKNDAKASTAISANFLPKLPVHVGQKVYRTKNQKLLDKIKERYLENGVKIELEGHFAAHVGEPMELTVSTPLQSVTVKGTVVEAAQKQPMTCEKILTQLNKTSATEFVFSHVDVTLDDAVFIPLVAINEIRREALAALRQKIVEQYRREKVIQHDDSTKVERNCDADLQSYKQSGISIHLIDARLMDVALSYPDVDNIYMDMQDISYEEIQQIAGKITNAKKRFYLVLPHVFRKDTYQEFMAHRAEIYQPDGAIEGYFIKNNEEYEFLRQIGVPADRICLDYNMYTMNRESKRFYHELGIRHFTSSIELNYSELQEQGCGDSDLIVYGYLPVMVSAQCLRKTTTGCTKVSGPLQMEDRMHKKWRVRNVCRYCYNLIYNHQPISLLENARDVEQLRPRNLRLDFTTETESKAREILSGFIDVFKKNRTSGLVIEDYTKGHFKRGID